jgi:hypothetical protein
VAKLERICCRSSVLISLFVFLYACGVSNGGAGHFSLKATDNHSRKVFVRLPLADINSEFVQRTGFIRDEKRDDIFAFGYLTESALESLPTAVDRDVIRLNEDLFRHHEYDAKSLSIKFDTRGFNKDDLSDMSGFHDYNALTFALRKMVDDYPKLAVLASAGKSVDGREIWYIKISSNAAVDEDQPRLLYIANMHGDEATGRELMIYLADLLLSEYGKTERITSLVNNAEIFIMPSMNPDGFENQTRFNANYIDLNRNFPDFTSDPNDTPDGRAPETQNIMTLHNKYHFDFAMNFHGGEILINIPWDAKPNGNQAEKFGDDAVIFPAAHEYADLNPEMKANNGGSIDHGVTYGYEWIEIHGGMQDWACYYRNSIHATAEVSSIKWPSSSSLPTYWEENREALLRYLERGMTGIHLKVTDVSGLAVPDLVVSVASLHRPIKYSETIIHRVTLSGEQQVTLSAPGFKDKTMNIVAGRFDGAVTKVLMER